MPSAAYLGRVGGLAVALGIGAAVVTGVDGGIAWADESGSTAGSTTSQAPSGTVQTAEKPGPADVAVAPPAKSGESDPDTPIASDDGIDADDTSSTLESESVTQPRSSADDDPPVIERKTSKGFDRTAIHRAISSVSASASSVADDKDDKHAAAAAVTVASEAAEDGEDTIDQAEPTPGVSGRFASTISAPLTASDTRLTSESPAAERRQPQPVGVVSRLLSGFVSAILSPFAVNSTPGEPAGAPLVWSLLAFARREFEAVFAPRPLRDAPVDVVTRSATEQRTLILSAFPAEADAILARTTLDPNPTVVVDGHHFYLGSMGDKLVIVGMTGIGMENATDTTQAALAQFTPESGISIGAVVFSGVAGGSGRTQIGSVAVPARWTSDDGATWQPVDADMLAVADTLAVDLESTVPLGDPLCLCSPIARLPLFDLNREPQLFVGGDGSSDDNNNGMAFPAIPFGGDVFGPQPCSAPNRSLLFTGNFFQAIGPFLVNGLLSNLTGLLMPQVPPVDAVDQETAAAQQVAAAHGIPFLGIRGMSDGPGDPLGLPGYPFTFFVYRQLAADNAAIVTEAFMQSWQGP